MGNGCEPALSNVPHGQPKNRGCGIKKGSIFCVVKGVMRTEGRRGLMGTKFANQVTFTKPYSNSTVRSKVRVPT